MLELIEENGGLSGLQGRIARERRRASYMQKCQGKMSQADAREKLRRGLTVLGLPLGNPSKLSAYDVMGSLDLMDLHDWKARDELGDKSAKIGLALVLNCSTTCKMYIESSGTKVYNDELNWGSLEELLQTRAHYQYLFDYTNGHFEHLVKDHAFEVWAEVMDKGLSEVMDKGLLPGVYVGAARILRKCARFGLPATLPLTSSPAPKTPWPPHSPPPTLRSRRGVSSCESIGQSESYSLKRAVRKCSGRSCAAPTRKRGQHAHVLSREEGFV